MGLFNILFQLPTRAILSIRCILHLPFNKARIWRILKIYVNKGRHRYENIYESNKDSHLHNNVPSSTVTDSRHAVFHFLECTFRKEQIGDFAMSVSRILLKILLFPISLFITVFIRITVFVAVRLAILLYLFSVLIFLGSLFAYLEYFFGFMGAGAKGEIITLLAATFGMLLSFFLSPLGLPSFMIWIVNKLDDLNQAIKSIKVNKDKRADDVILHVTTKTYFFE